MKPIRVAQIIGKMWAGGVETVVFNYYRGMDHTKVQFDFFYDADSTVEPPEELKKMGARFFELPPYQKLWSYIPTLSRYLKEGNYHIVHSHLNTLSVFPLLAAWSVGIPIRIAHRHSVPAGIEWKRNAAKNILRRFSKTFANNYFACSEQVGIWLFGKKAKVEVINNAIDFEKFESVSERSLKIKKELNLNGRFTVGHVGRFTFAKNHMKLLDVFSEILKKDSTAMLLLVGDGELHDQIVRKIDSLGLKEHIVMTGKVADPQDYYPLMNVVVLPSAFEGFPVTVIESQVARVPILASDVVPESAKISNGCKFMSIKSDNIEWADEAFKQSKIEVKLDLNAKYFDIRNCAEKLQDWYIKH